MSNKNLPDKIDPNRLTEGAGELHGVLLVKDMLRLCTNLANSDGEVQVDLVLGVDEEGTRFIQGRLKTSLNLQCQRCMETFIYEIMGDFLLGVVESEEEAAKLSERYEPAIIEEGMLAIRDIIEEELIVSLPIVSKHNPEDCKVQLPKLMIASDEAEHNPFKVIEILRGKNRNQE